MEAYSTALKTCGATPTTIGASNTKTGTLNAAIVAYYSSPDFRISLAPSTQQMRRAILESWRVEDGEKRFAGIRSNHLEAMLGAKKPNAQKNWIKTLRGLMKFAKRAGLRADDPAVDIEAAKAGKSSGHMPWLDAQVEQYRAHHTVGTVPRLALELLLNTAGRRQDAHMLGRQHINRDGKLCWRPQKKRRSTGKTLTISIMPELQAALDAMPPSNAMAFLCNDYGRPFASAAAFGNKFADWCVAAGLKPVRCDDGKVRNYRAHGLRRTALRALAHAGCTGSEMMNVSGHSSLTQLQGYINEVEQERQADAALIKLMAARKVKT
jgi:integrase/recombinase XerD